MKRLLAPMGLTLVICALACAQDSTGERVVVPARNSTRPRVVNVALTHGSITVKAYSGKEVIVEAGRTSGESRRPERTVDGLKRIDLPPRGLMVEEEDNVIQIRANSSESRSLVITVPTDTSLQLRSTHGKMVVEGVHGEIEAHSTNGEIELTGISGTVVADTTNGSIKASMDRVDAGKPIAFATTNGTVDVTLPADVKANLKLRTFHGEIYSDFEMKLTAGQPSATKTDSNGPFRVEFDRTMYATVNGGGTEISLRSLNGRLLIRKK